MISHFSQVPAFIVNVLLIISVESLQVRKTVIEMHAYLNILIDVREYLGASGPVLNFLNVDKRITTLAVNVNLNSYIENTKNVT